MPRLIAGDPLHCRSYLGVFRMPGLPLRDQGSEGFPHASFNGVLDRNVDERSRARLGGS
jgi:hypothetical protein